MQRRSSTKLALRIAIDTGGTFTDCVWVEAGRVRMLKVFSTPADPSQAIVEALQKIGLRGSVVVLHGTTVGTNTLLQRKGGRVALVTTRGFEDAIEIGRQARPKLYDFSFDRVEPLVAADLRFGVEECTPGELEKLINEIRRKHPEAIGISFLFSFANPGNERAAGDALRTLEVPLSISHQILPEFREYERTSTVVVNAYLQPVMERYLENLERRTQSWLQSVAKDSPGKGSSRQASIFVMQSNGGITALASAVREPVRTVLSGPAGGVVGAAASARRSGREQVIAFDMGGTTAKANLARDGEPQMSHGYHIGGNASGQPMMLPVVDTVEVGSGGGSIAKVDHTGSLKVGPVSAGADPGPACYGKGGTEPTVTDANLLLGRLPADRFLGVSSRWMRRAREAWSAIGSSRKVLL